MMRWCHPLVNQRLGRREGWWVLKNTKAGWEEVFSLEGNEDLFPPRRRAKGLYLRNICGLGENIQTNWCSQWNRLKYLKINPVSQNPGDWKPYEAHELKTEAQISSLKLLTVGRPCGSKESGFDYPWFSTIRDIEEACADRKRSRGSTPVWH